MMIKFITTIDHSTYQSLLLNLVSTRRHYRNCRHYQCNHSSYYSISKDNTIAIAMSGGIDSSAAAMILKDKGYNCIGVYMTNWDLRDEYGSSRDDNNKNQSCQFYDDIRDMKQVCERIGIPAIEVLSTSIYYVCYLLYI